MTRIHVDRASCEKALFFSVPGPVSDRLGPRPRDSLAALVSYGMTDAEIAEYHGLPRETVTHLRLLYDIRDGR